jgi:hypothetical protein
MSTLKEPEEISINKQLDEIAKANNGRDVGII